MKKLFCLIFVLFLSFLAACKEKEKNIPFDQYDAVRRDILIENDTEGTVLLSGKERHVGRLFRQYMQEYIKENSSSTALFPELKPKIEKSKLFQLIRLMPKGANLHLHAPVLLPAEKLYDLASKTKKHVYLLETG